MTGHLLLLLLFLYVTSSNARVFVSIDCGASANYTDQNSIEWIGDDALIRYGETMQVQNQFMYGNSNALTTLRAFPARKKSCYSIGADQGIQKGQRVLLRASFLYGNYNDESRPPTFALHFDGNYWATVRTDNFSTVVEEVIYVTKGDTVSVCVAKTHENQLPFVSSIEIRSLELDMYNNIDVNYALIGVNRIAYGVKSTVRYPTDRYDRIWDPELVLSPQIEVTSDVSSINVNVEDDPPLVLFQSAMTAPRSYESMDLSNDFFSLPFSEVPIYINMYFSESTKLSHSRARAFDFYINNEAQNIYPIIPPYGSVIEMTVPNATATFFSSFSLNATSGSTLPPLINGLELFTISNRLTDGTNSTDVEAIASLQNTFDILQKWAGDPCLPVPFMWDWVNCSFTAIPRVTALYLSNHNLTGSFPSFSSMDALQILDLRNNNLSGPIPDFLRTLPNLKQLNLADNNFSGPIPASLINNKELQLVISGNPGLCNAGVPCYGAAEVPIPSPGNSTNKKLPAILGLAIVSSIALLGIVIVVTVLHRRTAKAKSLPGTHMKSFPRVPSLSLYRGDSQIKDLIESPQSLHNDGDEITVPYFDMDSILSATENFSEAKKLGRGGFGPVYKGNFPGGQEMAVKRLSSSSVQGLEEFKNEVLLIAKLQHRNLVRLLGYCIQEDEKILLYEYMPNKSLDYFIFDSKLGFSLNWEMRFNIIMGIARGMLYLHQDSRLRIIHRDLKTSNILLDEDMNPKISDFGLARIFGGQQTEWTTRTVIGTCGYMSPEYALDGIFSVKSDVFSFGVVLLEIVSGKRNTGYYQTAQSLSLLGYAWKLWREGNTLELLDKRLRGACNVSELARCVNVGLLCAELDPCDRPNMPDVVLMLGSNNANLPRPQQPAFTLSKSLADLASS